MLSAQTEITESERADGLKRLVIEAAFANTTAALTTGVVLTAFALHLGANTAVIGLLAAIPFLAQLAQAPAVLLVERLRARKRIAVLSSLVGRTMLGVMALLPFAGSAARPLLVAATVVLCVMAAVGSCAWNAWMRDFAPEDRIGRVFARRTQWATGTTLAASLAAALLLELAPPRSAWRDYAFCGLYGIGCLAGLVSASIVARIPEPVMAPPDARGADLRGLLAQPFTDRNFVRLITFLAAWQFAINLATPFFTVYMVNQLGYSMSVVMGLSIASQVANALTIVPWGSLADRHSNKSVLLVAAPAYVVSIVGMIGASQLDGSERLAWLGLLHLLMGASVAGVTLASTNIALRLSPRGEAAAYLAASGMATAVAAGSAPILGGLWANFFAERRFEVILRWSDPQGISAVSAVTLSTWDWYFLLSGLLGLYALQRLSAVREQGEIDRRQMVQHILGQARDSIHNFSTVTGLKVLTVLPGTVLREARVRQRYLRLQRRRGTVSRRASPSPR